MYQTWGLKNRERNIGFVKAKQSLLEVLVYFVFPFSLWKTTEPSAKGPKLPMILVGTLPRGKTVFKSLHAETQTVDDDGFTKPRNISG